MQIAKAAAPFFFFYLNTVAHLPASWNFYFQNFKKSEEHECITTWSKAEKELKELEKLEKEELQEGKSKLDDN